ncbi:hypothetical protein LOAG_14878, partial [Loa loa]
PASPVFSGWPMIAQLLRLRGVWAYVCLANALDGLDALAAVFLPIFVCFRRLLVLTEWCN